MRQAREQAGLSLDELAQATKLARPTLEALETDDFAVLNEAVYIRGYYRKVAKALALPEQELIAAYAARATPSAPPAPTKLLLGSGDNGPHRPRRRGGWGWLVALVIVIGLLLLALRWLGRDAPLVGATVSPVTGSTPTADAGRVAAAESSNAPSALASTSVSEQPAIAADAPIPSATPSADAPNAAPSRSAEISSAPKSPAPAAAAAAAVAAEADGDALSLNFRSDSWVRIEDAYGKVLLTGVMKGGTQQSVSGRAPLSVFLGKAAGVDVSFAGKPIDVTQYVKPNGATAHFSVP